MASGANCCGRSLPHELIRRTQDIAIHLVTRQSDSVAGAAAQPRAFVADAAAASSTPRYAVATAAAVGKGLTALTPIPNLSILFLVAVVMMAVNFGIWPAIFASVLSFFTFNFFFIPPLYNFTIAEPYANCWRWLCFSSSPSSPRRWAGGCANRQPSPPDACSATRRLYEFTRRLSGLASFEAVAEGAASEIHASLGRAVVVLLDTDGDLALTAAWPPEDELDPAPMMAARWAYSHGEPAGADTGTLPIIPWYFVPLRIGDRRLGVIGVAKPAGIGPLDSEGRALLDALSEQAAAALERASLARDMVTAKTATETERVRNTLLASISHDFRTPLSSILGAATSLIDYGDKLDAAAKKDMLLQIKQETEGLDEMVRNLLAITRIDAGALELRRDWIDLHEIADRVVSAARRRGAAQTFDVALPTDLPLVRADATLVEQAIGNVIGNAISHTPPQTRVRIEAAVGSDTVALLVSDDGPGIPAETLPQVFEKFIKADTLADGGQGTGLGLAIAKGIMEAHGGTIAAISPLCWRRRHAHHLDLPARGDAGMSANTLVLVVDDEAAILRFLKPALEANGYDMASAGSVAEATKRIAAESPDIVLLDLGLPDGDGKEVINARANGPDVPIIVLSARERETEKIESLDLGADDYVNKPFNVGELLARMRNRSAPSHAAQGGSAGTARRQSRSRRGASPRYPCRRRTEVDAEGIRAAVVSARNTPAGC